MLRTSEIYISCKLSYENMHAKKVILIGIDGCDWTILNKLFEKKVAPTLEEVVNNGVAAKLLSTIPIHSFPSWNSIFTGTNPGKHGIIDVLIRIKGKICFSSSRFRKKPPLWIYLSKFNKRSIIVNDPTTYPPEPFNGIILTGFMTPSNAKNYSYPLEISDKINRITGGYWCEVPRKYYSYLRRKNYSDAFNLIQGFSLKSLSAGLYLIRNYSWDLFALIITSTDRLQHFYLDKYWYIEKHYRILDRYLSKFLNMSLEENAEVIILSDHGFRTVRKCLNLNAFLKLINLQKKKTTDYFFTALTPEARSLIKSFLAKYFTKICKKEPQSKIFTNDLAYALTGSGIYINDRLSSETRKIILKKLLISLNNLKDNNKIRPIKNIYIREKVLWGPYASWAPELLLIGNDEYFLSSDPLTLRLFEHPTTEGVKITGTHRREGIFIAYGSSFKKKIFLKKSLYVWDILPTILHLMDIPVPLYVDGAVRKDIFKETSDAFSRSVNWFRFKLKEKIHKRILKIKKKL